MHQHQFNRVVSAFWQNRSYCGKIIFMETELINYEKITRHIWQNLYKKTIPPLTEAELDNIKSINDEISVQDVNDV